MLKKLWFISEEFDVIEVFDDQEIASNELFFLKKCDPKGIFNFYGLSYNELKYYSDEYYYAQSKGFLDD